MDLEARTQQMRIRPVKEEMPSSQVNCCRGRTSQGCIHDPKNMVRNAMFVLLPQTSNNLMTSAHMQEDLYVGSFKDRPCHGFQSNDSNVIETQFLHL